MLRCFKPVFATAALALTTAAAPAQQATQPDYNHAGQFDAYVLGQFLWGDHIIHATGPGLGLGYNFCDHLSLNLEGYVGDLDVKINDIHGVGTTYDLTGNLEYKFMTGRFRPYVTAGFGIFNYDVKDHDPNPVLLNTSSTGVMYGGGLGVSYDITRHWFFKGAWRVWNTTVNGVGLMTGPELCAGYNF